MSDSDNWRRLSELGYEAEAQGDLETAFLRHGEAVRLLADAIVHDRSLSRSQLGLEFLQSARIAAMTGRQDVTELFLAALDCALYPPEPRLRSLIWRYVGAWFQRRELWVPSLLAYQEAFDALPQDAANERRDALQLQLVPIDRLQEWFGLLATLRQLADAGVPLGQTEDLPAIPAVLEQLDLSETDRRNVERVLADASQVQALRDDLLARAREVVPDFVRRFEAGEFERSDDGPDPAQAEAFNRGVELAATGGHDEDAEAAYRSAINGPDIEVAAMAAVNLGGLLEEQPGRVAEAEEAYRRAIASQHPDQSPMAAANLGTLLSGVPGREDDAEALLVDAADSGHPEHGNRARFNLGMLLLSRPGRRADAEAAFRAAAASGHPEHASAAAYNLGRLLAEDPARLDDARQALKQAAASGHAGVAPVAEHMLAHLSGETPAAVPTPESSTSLLERPVVDVARLGLHRLTLSSDGAGTVLEEHAPAGQTLETLTELLTVVSAPDAGIALRAVAESSDAAIARRVINGRYLFSVLHDGDDELAYGWTLEEDAIAVDQAERSRVIRRGQMMHVVTYTVRKPVGEALRRIDEVWPVVTEAALAHVPLPEATPSPPPLPEALELLERLQDPGDGDAGEREALVRRALGLVDRGSQPQLWASLQVVAGLQAREHPDGGAVATLRGALQVIGQDTEIPMWGQALAHLARAYGLDAPGHTVALLERALAELPEGSPEWTEALVDLGYVHEATGDLDAAARRYGEALDRMVAAPLGDLLDNEDPNGVAHRSNPYIRATAGVQRVDQVRSGSPFVPQPPAAREQRQHEVVYLRPFIYTGGLTIANRFRGRDWYVPRDGREPEWMTLEAVLHRAFGADLLVSSVGGRGEGYGMARIGILAGRGDSWQELVELVVKRAAAVLLTPHRSEGVHWEIGLLVRTGAIARTLVIMPPRSQSLDVAAVWEDARPLLAEHDLPVPPYDPDGLLLRCAPRRGVLEAWPFAEVFDGRALRRILALVGEAVPRET